MRHATRHRRNRTRSRPRLEALEGRALLAAAGSLDPSFGAGYGSSTVPLSVPVQAGVTISASSTATTADGHIVASATISTSQASALVVEELNPDGTLDSSFGAGGAAVVPVESGTHYTLAVEANGQILAARTSVPPADTMPTNNLLAFRLNVNGTLDTTFGTNGFFSYPSNTTIPGVDQLQNVASVLPLPGGQIVLAGDATAGPAALRLNSDGSVDTTYGSGGTAVVPFLRSEGYADTTTGAALEANGQVVLAGSAFMENLLMDGILTAQEAVVVRLNSDGSTDTTFAGGANGGIAVLPFNPSNTAASGLDGALQVAVQPNTGDLLVTTAVSVQDANVGAIFSDSVAYYTLDRLDADGNLDATFGTKGQALPGVPVGNGPPSLAVQADGGILLSSSVNNGYGSLTGTAQQNLSNATVLRLTPTGAPDATFGNTGAFGNNSTPGLLVTRLNSASPNVAIQPVNDDLILAGVSIIPSIAGQTYGITVDSILPAASTGAAALAPPPPPPADLLATGSSDGAVYDPTNGTFYYQSYASATSTTAPPFTFQFGPAGAGMTIPAVADYRGSGYDQVGAYLPQSGTYAVLATATSPAVAIQFGSAGAGQTIPVPADYQGTGKADVAVYLVAQGTFAIIPADGGAPYGVQFGIGGAGQSIPAPADYYGTGQADIAVYLAQYGEFAIQDPTGKTPGEVISFGAPGLGVSIPVPGDYDGSGHTEVAVYIPILGAYYYRPYGGGADVKVPIGTADSGQIPAPGDYDGSGRTEAAVYDPSTGTLIYQPAKGGPDVTISIGTADDGSLPVAAPAGALPEFAYHPPSGGGSGITLGGISAPGGGPGTASPASITVSPASAVPAGPKLASIRVARVLINQATPADPFKLG